MNVSKVIIHEIEKRQGHREAFLTSSKDLLPIEERTNKLIEQLNKSFGNESKIVRTEFEELERHFFKPELDNLLKENNDRHFYEFSILTINQLRNKLQDSPFATGGYYVFVNYENLGREYLGIFIVRDSDKLLFKRNENNTGFEIDEATIVDTEKLAMACRIDIGRYSEDEIRYLQFTNYLKQDISDYFIHWIEANVAHKSRDDSNQLIKILNNIKLPIDPDTDKIFTEDKFFEKVYNHINSTSKVVRLKELSASFWDDENFLLNYVEENDIEINNEFRAISAIVKKLKFREIKADNIRIIFKQGNLNNGNIRRGKSPKTIIIESEALRREFDNLETND